MKPAPAGRPPRGGPGETQPKSSPRERVTITREAVPVRWAQKDSSSGSPGAGRTQSSPRCAGDDGTLGGTLLFCAAGIRRWRCLQTRPGVGGEEDQRSSMFPLQKRVRRACRKQEGKRGRGGGREGGTHLKPSTGSQGHLHSLPPAAPHAVNLSTPLPTQGHNQSLLRPARSPLLVGLFPRHADNAGSQ